MFHPAKLGFTSRGYTHGRMRKNCPRKSAFISASIRFYKNMNKKILLISIIAIAALLVGLFLLDLAGLISLDQLIPSLGEQQKEPMASEETPSQPKYPNNLVEGKILAVDLEGKTLKLEAKTSLIKTAKRDVMEKTIKFTDDTEWTTYHIPSEEESSFEFSEIKVDDNIVVATVESTFDKINELEEFTATKITKMITE